MNLQTSQKEKIFIFRVKQRNVKCEQLLCLEMTDPLRTPRTRLRTKKEPKITKLTKYTHGSSNPMASFICAQTQHAEREKTQWKVSTSYVIGQAIKYDTTMHFTQYSTSVHPSMVMHWNTVNMAKKKLSKFVIPPLGPSHLPRHSEPFMMHWRPWPANAHGTGSSST